MGKGRRDGEGSIYRRSDGRWVAAVSLGRGVDGKRRRRVLYGATGEEVRQKRDELLRSLDDHGSVSSTRPGSLDAYLETWLSVTLRQRVAAGDLKESTRAIYAEKLRAYVIGTRLGRMRLEEIRPPDVREWLGWLSTRPTSRRDKATGKPRLMAPGGVAIVYRTLRAALADAVEDEILRRSPAVGVRLPKVRKVRHGDPLPLDEAIRVLEVAAGARLEALWIVFMYLGLRHGEALALRWDDVDLDAGKLRVRRTAGWVKDPETGERTLVEGDTKTEASDADVPVPTVVVDALRAHQGRQRRERLAARVWVRPELVFASEAGTMLDSSNVRKAWNRLCADAGVRPRRIHDLRHTTASLLYLAGVPVETISTILRHGSPTVTRDIYAHVFSELRRDATDALADLFARAQSDG